METMATELVAEAAMATAPEPGTTIAPEPSSKARLIRTPR
jgi:hypothetical protein